MKLSIALASAVAANVVEKVDEVTTEATGTTSPPFHPDGKHPCEPNDERDKFNGGTFPENFIWSIGSNAYNIEGGWNAAGKGNSIWDEYANGRFTREEVDEFWANDNGRHENAEPQQDQICLDAGKTDCWCKVDDCMDGNTAANSWAHVDRDIENLKSLGIKSYRFSLSWSRLMPDGINPNTNSEGAEYYHTLLDKLIEAGIDPIVALYAYDLPVELSKDIEVGDDDEAWPDQCFGWTCYEIIGHFTEYARYAFTEYGDKVKNWITFVEPAVMADRGYGDCSFPPAMPEICNNMAQFAERTARHNALQAHVAAYHLYKNEFNGADGKCGIILNSRWAQANDETNPDDVAAAEREMALYVGWFADPIFGNGTYSDTLREMLEKEDEWVSMYEFTEEQAALNAGSADFFAINHYNTMLVQANEDKPYGYEVLPPCEQWEATGSTWNNLAPWGMRRILWWIHQHYDSTKYPIWITENGLATIDGDEDGDHDGESDPLNDWFRIDHLNAYMGQTLRAIIEDGANVEMYTAWSLMDGFEWNRGYTERFGLFYTNFTELDATTTPKRSADWYAKVIHYNCAPGTNENCFPQDIPDSNSTDIPSTDGTDSTDPTSNAVTLAASTLLSALLALFL